MIVRKSSLVQLSSFPREELLRDERALELLLGNSDRPPEARLLSPLQVGWLLDNLQSAADRKNPKELYLSALVLESPRQHEVLLRSALLPDLLLMPMLNDNQTMLGYAANVMLSLAHSRPAQTLALLRQTPGLWDRTVELARDERFCQLIVALLCHQAADHADLDSFFKDSPDQLAAAVLSQMHKMGYRAAVSPLHLRRLFKGVAAGSKELLKGCLAALKMMLARQPLNQAEHQLFYFISTLPLAEQLCLEKGGVRHPNGQEVARVGLGNIRLLELIKLAAEIRPEMVTASLVQFVLGMFEASKWADMAFRVGTDLVKQFLQGGGALNLDAVYWLMKHFRSRYFIFLSSGHLTTLGYFQFVKAICAQVEGSAAQLGQGAEHWREFVEKDLRLVDQLEEGPLGGEPQPRREIDSQGLGECSPEWEDELFCFQQRKQVFLRN